MISITRDSVDQLWSAALRCLLDARTRESRNGLSREIINANLQLRDPEQSLLTNHRRKIDPVYACAELVWYMQRTGETRMIERYAPNYSKYANNGIAYGAYGARFKSQDPLGKDQLHGVVEALTLNPESRRVVVSLYRSSDIFAGMGNQIKDIPCTTTWQFLIYQGRLSMITNMRSHDAWLGMPYDVFVNTSIQRAIADELNLPLGPYYHNIGSLHIYEKHVEAAREAIESDHAPCSNWCVSDGKISLAELDKLAWLEQSLRTTQSPPANLDSVNRSALSQTVIDVLRWKWEGAKFVNGHANMHLAISRRPHPC